MNKLPLPSVRSSMYFMIIDVSEKTERQKLKDYMCNIRKNCSVPCDPYLHKIMLVGDAESISACLYNIFDISDKVEIVLMIINSDSCKIGSNIPINIISESLHDLMFPSNSIRTFPFLHCQQLRELKFGAHCCDHSPYLFLSCLETPHLRKVVFESSSFSGTTLCIIRNLPFLQSIIVNDSAFSPLLFPTYIRISLHSLLSRVHWLRERSFYRLSFRTAHSRQPPFALHLVSHKRVLSRLSLRSPSQSPSLDFIHYRK